LADEPMVNIIAAVLERRVIAKILTHLGGERGAGCRPGPRRASRCSITLVEPHLPSDTRPRRQRMARDSEPAQCSA
jgi:hypothetical protein